MSDDNNLFVKLTKPQMLLLKKILREGCVVYVVSVIVFFIANIFSDYHSWGLMVRSFDSLFTAAFTLCLFLVFVPYVSVRWTIASYLTLRKQVMEEDSKNHSL